MDDKVIIAFKKGYRSDKDGQVTSNRGYLNCFKNNKGYMQFSSARIDGLQRQISVHRLQAYQKYGNSMFEDGIVVRHLNGVRDDNSWDNIAIGTESDNRMDIPQHIRVASALYASSFNQKYDKDEVKAFYQETKSYKKTMEEFGISSKGTLHYILNK